MTVSLTDLLARAKAEVELKAKAKVTETKVKTARSAAAKAEATAEHLALTSVLDWNETALVYRQLHWVCACGAAGLSPDGLYILHEHKRLADTTRLVRYIEEGYPDLPRRVLNHKESVGLCPSCSSQDQGFTKLLETRESQQLRLATLPASRAFYTERRPEGAWAHVFINQRPEYQDDTSPNDDE